VGGVETVAQSGTGRLNQKTRTRRAIIDACRDLIRSGSLVTMPEVARAALVSEATAYRYFPDLTSIITEALQGMWPSSAEALAPVAGSADPVERIGFACEFLARRVLAYEGSVRAMIAATITHPDGPRRRPGIRFGLIDAALDPVAAGMTGVGPVRLARLKHDLAAVVSAEALFSLTDLAGLDAEEAIASLVRIARTIVAATLREGAASHPARPTQAARRTQAARTAGPAQAAQAARPTQAADPRASTRTASGSRTSTRSTSTPAGH
jgi:AcrR family transcriptional regulator